MMEDIDERPATSIEALDLHLRYMRRDMKTVLEAIQSMATKRDVDSLAGRIKEIEDRMQRRDDARETPFWIWVARITKLGAAFAVVLAGFGGLATVVHFWDRLDSLAKAEGKK